MNWLRISFARLLGFFRKRRLEKDLDAELRQHLELLAQENIRRGMNQEEALYAANVFLGE
jgi:hypothetical protein